MVRFGSDGRAIWPGPAPAVHKRELANDTFVDEWGVTWQRRPSVAYYEVVDAPLANATEDDIERYAWPDLTHPSRFGGLASKARAIRANGYAVVAMTGVSPFEQIGLLRGLAAWLIDLAVNPEFAQALLNKVTSLMKASVVKLLEEAGDYIDVVVTSDDLGTQKAPMISPRMYRKMVKPYHAELLSAIKSRTKAKVFFHSDGNIYPLIGDLVEIGVDLLNPVQVSATNMGDTARLKREFGDRLSFCGGIDTQDVLPRGTMNDVRREVRRRIQDLAPGGGYVLAAVHCIQPDVPPENVCAMFDEAIKVGHYPLTF
jgi:uroporphyrinogen decarboxylase